MLVRIKAEIGRVLVPGGKGRAVGLLDEEGRGVDEDVGADQVLDDIEDASVTDEPVEPGQHDIGRRAPAPVALVNRPAKPSFVTREALVAFGELRGGQSREREQIAVVAILLDLFLVQHCPTFTVIPWAFSPRT